MTTNTKSQLAEAHNRISELQSGYERLRLAHEELRQAHQSLQTDRVTLSADADELRRQIVMHKDEIASFNESEVAALKATVDQQNNQIIELRAKLKAKS